MAKRVSDVRKEEPGDQRPAGGEKPANAGEPSLKGTFASVMLLGAFLVVTWVSVFVLYVHRN
ncbi:hypothetical protein [Cohnella thermotolerans]|uniref:hypothetical protein n=1 Tax=Cohnella thermotolerans TaxID=329858 RepID=UPI0003FCE58C|nr:hypothetical protein [Cohnella thermotolerans]